MMENSERNSGKIDANPGENLDKNGLSRALLELRIVEEEQNVYSRYLNLLAVLEDKEVQADGKLKDRTESDLSYGDIRDQFLKIIPLIEVLNLGNKTQEEIREELHVDFSTLDTSTMPKDERMNAKMQLYFYANNYQVRKFRPLVEKLHPSDRTKYDLWKFNTGIVALGVENFMKAATQFCEEEAAAGEIPIVSIGSGDGTVEKEIIAQYRERFGKEIRIKLVDPDPKFDGIVDFKTVDHLIAGNPRIVGNCAAFIIWPYPNGEAECGGYDIEAIRKLKPKAVLTVYESTGDSGSENFRNFLRDDSLDELSPEEFGINNWWDKFILQQKKNDISVDNYKVLEVARQKILLPRIGTSIYRIVKIIRENCT